MFDVQNGFDRFLALIRLDNRFQGFLVFMLNRTIKAEVLDQARFGFLRLGIIGLLAQHGAFAGPHLKGLTGAELLQVGARADADRIEVVVKPRLAVLLQVVDVFLVL